MLEGTVPDSVLGVNLYSCLPDLSRFLRRRLGDAAFDWAQPKLEWMGAQAGGAMQELAWLADRNPPSLEAVDPQGRRINHVRVHPAYQELKRIAYNEAGLVALAYDEENRKAHGPNLHAVKFASGMLFAHAEQGLFCPICLTDGTARLLEMFGGGPANDRFFSDLTATTCDPPVQGAMFLTERPGGSDVGSNEVVARKDGDVWRVNGEKWFCSNAEADVALITARPEGAQEGTRGLGLFAVPRLLENGQPNGQVLQRLKDKMGTRSMPTGEIVYQDAVAYQVGELDKGFKQMAEMLNLSRLYNSVASVAIMRSTMIHAWAYASRRRAFGNRLIEFPLVQDQLIQQAAELEGAMHLVWDTINGLDRRDSKQATDEDLALWRLLTPLAKLSTAKQAVRLSSEALELLGGNGYMEEWPTARLYRDAQVLPVWEGTTNVLSLDTFRVFQKEGTAELLLSKISEGLNHAPNPETQTLLETTVVALGADLKTLAGLDPLQATVHMRAWCERAAAAWATARMFEAATLGERETGLAIAHAWRRLGTPTAGGVDQRRTADLDIMPLVFPEGPF